ncbi:MAG: DEAD/DEAH box helicase, partial [Nanoarchaeota archaeon]|nr:DEAD/DEAH box helicase [Nanoarchaeota archaeon]
MSQVLNSFDELNLDENLKKSLQKAGFSAPTEIQSRALPYVLEGKDVFIRSKTGTGKTAVFLIPIINYLESNKLSGRPSALIVLPTRELSLQVWHVARQLCSFSDIKAAVVYGGVSLNPQIDKLRRGADIIVGTPGRILDLIHRRALDIGKIKFLVLDEADLMLDIGFIDDIEQIIKETPKSKQVILLSATLLKEVEDMAKKYMNNPVYISSDDSALIVDTIKNDFVVVNYRDKFSALLAFLDEHKPRKAIVFVEQKRSVYFVSDLLRKFGYSPISLHGGMTQKQREFSIEEFKAEEAGLLVATNVAARGLDIPNVTDIINFDAPDDPKVYIHRVGRSARMGKEGRAFTIFMNRQRGLLNDIERMSGKEFNEISLDLSKFSNAEGNNFERDLNPLSYENNHGRQGFYHPSN